MAEMWEVVAPVDQIPVLLDPRRRINSTVVDDLDSWNTCPIDNMKHNSCFHLPGVTDGPAPLNQ